MTCVSMSTKVILTLDTLYNPLLLEEPIFFLELRFNYKHERLYRDVEGSEHVIDVRPIGSSSGLSLQIHPQLLNHPSRCCLHIHNVLSSFNLDVEVRAHLTHRIAPFLIATANTREWPLLGFYAVANVEIVSQEYVDAGENIPVMRAELVDGGYVFDDVGEPRRRGGGSRLDVGRLKKKSSFYYKKEGECAICLEDLSGLMRVIKMCCSHIFHENCISRWLENRNSCPLCRREVD